MLMSLPELVDAYDMKISGILHVGAHLAEEAPTYRDLGIDNVWWIEANPRVAGVLQEILAPYDHHLISALVYEVDGEQLEFKITNHDGMSSSILEFGTHPTFSPDTVFVERVTLPTSTIDTLVGSWLIEDVNFLNMDLQGAELHALKGASKTLDSIEYIMTEVNKAEVYVGCARIEQLDDILDSFDRVETYWVGDQGWGDALYVRRDL